MTAAPRAASTAAAMTLFSRRTFMTRLRMPSGGCSCTIFSISSDLVVAMAMALALSSTVIGLGRSTVSAGTVRGLGARGAFTDSRVDACTKGALGPRLRRPCFLIPVAATVRALPRSIRDQGLRGGNFASFGWGIF